jgi:DNA-binding transcriptional MerR regulator
MDHKEEIRLNINELSARTGVPVRTIHYYLAEGILPSPGARGKAARYGEETVLRLRLVRRLVEQRLPLAEIKTRLDGLSADDLRRLLDEDDRRQSRLEQAAQAGSPREYLAVLMELPRTTLPAASARRRAQLLQPTPSHYPARDIPPPASPRGEVWSRWQLAPGVELHASQSALARFGALVERLLQLARSVEDQADQ